MEQNLEKILYLASGIVLFIMAITSFHSYYSNYQNYIMESGKNIAEDYVIKNNAPVMTRKALGSEVLHLILDKKKQEDALVLWDSYHETGEGVNKELETNGQITEARGIAEIPEIFFEGTNALTLNLNAVDLWNCYDVRYDMDSDGNVISVWYY